MWKRNLILVIALHIGLCLFPLLTVPQEKLTAIRVATAMGVVVFIYLIEVLLIYSTIRKHGLKPKEGLIRILELKEEEYTELKEEERRLVEKIGFLIIGFPLLAFWRYFNLGRYRAGYQVLACLLRLHNPAAPALRTSNRNFTSLV